jgi:hypothetical protein
VRVGGLVKSDYSSGVLERAVGDLQLNAAEEVQDLVMQMLEDVD